MTYRTFRRRLSEATAAHDWLEGASFVLGLGFLGVTRGFAIVLFTLFGVVALAVGWFFAGDTFKRWIGRARSRG